VSTYTLRSHRLGGAAALAVAGLVGGGGAAVATLASYGGESIAEYQVDATLNGDTLSVVETIDYDFGTSQHHGIFRDVDLGVVDSPDRVTLENPTAASESASANLEVDDLGSNATLKVGDANQTEMGLHRYQLSYDLVGVPDPSSTGRFVYIAIGDRWEVPIDDVTIRVATDFEPGDVTCSIGTQGSFNPCDVSDEDGVVTAKVPHVDEREGVVLTIGSGVARTPAVLTNPSLDLGEPSTPWVEQAASVGGATAGAALLGSLLAGRWVRRAGADRTASLYNPSDAAFATVPPPGGVPAPSGEVGPAVEGTAISDVEADKQVTIQFVPPEGLTPPQGSVLLNEKVTDAAKTAWLAQASIDDWITLEGDPGSPTIRRGQRSLNDPSLMPAPIGMIFNGREELQLGSYDSSFAAGWGAIGGQLFSWRSSSGLWDARRGLRNKAKAFGLLALGVVAGGIVGLALAAGLGHDTSIAVPVSAVAGLLLGVGVRAAFGTPTLDVRSPAGYGLWLRTEGFRRFLHDSEGQHARWAADHGLLREYSAWAVALGELDRWNRAASAAGIPPNDPGMASTYAFIGLASMAHSTSVAPSSSGSSGGFGGGGFSGGGFGGGVGGGGGGSW
jgi:hypothetical protein